MPWDEIDPPASSWTNQGNRSGPFDGGIFDPAIFDCEGPDMWTEIDDPPDFWTPATS